MNRAIEKQGRHGGFTLIELMMVIVIMAILLVVVLPAFQDQIRRGHRAAAKSEMLDIANRQQQFLLANRAYTADVGELSYSMPAEVKDRYADPPTITLGGGAVPSYRMTFVAKGSQASDGDLWITSEGAKGPPEKWQR